ncbi:MAG: hypothetical protein CM1200mP34_3200 [Verrucomicrobiales bacterium]|nr:MAG: hypothetical protein CM1200mP34_3200 [Verrucomicrobiales bacterium]
MGKRDFLLSYADMRLKERKYPELWAALKRVVRGAIARGLFEAEHVWWPKAHHFEEQATRFNAALEASVQSVLLGEAGRQTDRAGALLLAVNTKPCLTPTVPPAWKTAGKVPVAFEGRPATTDGSWVVDRFPPSPCSVRPATASRSLTYSGR